MASVSILRIPTEEAGKGFVLVQVVSAGTKALDLKLVATEGNAPYALRLKHESIDKLRASNSPCSSDEWEAILTAVLYNSEAQKGVEAVAKIHDGRLVDIIVRRRVEGINQKLGSLTFKYKEKEEIDVVDWCSEAILSREGIQAELAAAKAQTTNLESVVSQLKGQLEELIQAKNTDESEMLEKFRDLLNEKKAKIRELQQSIGNTGVPGAGLRQTASRSQTAADMEVDEPDVSPPKGRTRRAAASRQVAAPKKRGPGRPKRKVAQAAISDDEDSPVEDVEAMDVDVKAEDNEEPSDNQATTEGSETGSDTEDDAPKPTQRQPPVKTSDAGAPTQQGAKPKALPPSRVLPFNVNKSTAAKSKPPVPVPAAASGSATESDDDEL